MSESGDSGDDRTTTGAASPLGGVGRGPIGTQTTLDPSTLGLLAQTTAGSDSSLARRQMVARYAGLAFGGDRDYYDVLGYDRQPEAEDYFTKYLRNDIARRIVNAPAKASWSERPNIIDDANEGTEEDSTTPFEKAVEYLFDEHRLLHYLERVDKVTGIGEYGLLFLGLSPSGDQEVDLADDAREGNYPAIPETMNDPGPDGLAYLATFSQVRVLEMDTVDDPANPRYGLPRRYNIEFSTDRASRTVDTHHSRVIHVAEGLLENEIFGRPRLEAVLNRLEDLEKVVGGSAEMYWRGADRKMQLNYTGEGSITDSDELQTQAEEMIHGLRNILRTSNVDVNTLGGEAVDPTGIVEQLLKLIAGETGIPVRMLTGSERGELASTQDRATFYERIGQRREQFCEPAILRPVIDRLILLGILPEPEGDGYTIEWPELFELNELEQAQLQKTKAQALKEASPMGDPAQSATVPEIRENILDWDPEMGEEVSIDVDPVDPADPGEDPAEETEEERDAFEDILEEVQLGTEAARPDGGTAQSNEESDT